MDILLPVGRMIGGDMYTPQVRKDNFGKPKLDAKGEAVTGFDFGVAIAKQSETDWKATPWGAQIHAVGVAAYPSMWNTPTFAWKITDGDSKIPNKKGVPPCSRDGYPGHWVLWFSQGWAPKLCNADGSQDLTEPDSVVPGYYIQVAFSVKSNAPSPTPGVYLNPIAVAFAAFGERIQTSTVDTKTLGFGGTLPPGASAVPVGAMTLPTPPAPVNTAFTVIPPPKVMLPAANGGTYEQYKTAGWTDAQMIAGGLLAA